MNQCDERGISGGGRINGSKSPNTCALRGSAIEVLLAFLKLGLTSFGGPVAHLGYFRKEFVERRAWLDDRS
jgi:chromate transporter